MSWFVALVQDADSSHANPYACAGSGNAKRSLRLCGLPTLHTPILTPVKPPVPGQEGSLVPPGIPGAYHFDELHPQKESCGESGDAPTRFG
ncbi:hypothetical protein O181_126817 [Austropuccinia psidii MF-1]|uniref:Uncharacterized protein n=1 Tax=Austropuccinia psidii MF-1 TaxID=1389203 RepID=A0A9Q3KWN9_9BASI|nr:hypothetical protein [Austropuccinia psidii MF-1]